MNKLFTKIAALALGATMAVGVGVAVASSGDVASVEASITDAEASGLTVLTSSNFDTSAEYVLKSTDGYYWNGVSGTSSSKWGGITKTNSQVERLTISGTWSNGFTIEDTSGNYLRATTGNMTWATTQAGTFKMGTDSASHPIVYNGTSNGLKVNGTSGMRLYTNLTYNASTGKSVALYKIPATKTLSSISVSGYTTEFTVGDTFSFGGTVTAHYSDSTTANVTSSATFSGYNMSVAGNYTVTASYTEGGTTKTATYGITVSAPTTPFIEPAKSSTSGYTGQNETLSFTYGNLTSTLGVSSSNTSVVTVETPSYSAGSGTVQINFVGAGSTTVKFNDGSTELASVSVTVTASSVLITGMPATKSIGNGATIDLGALITVTPTGTCSSDVTWSTGNSSIATVTQVGVVTGEGLGSTTITVTPDDYPAGAVSCTVTVANVMSAVFGTTGSSSSTEVTDASKYKTDYSYTIDTNITLSDISKVYPQTSNALKFGSSSVVGSMTFSIPSTIDSKSVYITSVTVRAVRYHETKGTTMLIGGVEKTLTYSADDYTVDLSSSEGTSFVLTADSSSSDKRMYVQSVSIQYAFKKTLSSIALSGSYQTTFTKGGTFNHDGLVVTATYSDSSTADVTSSATFSGYNLSNVGNQTVTVSYTEGTTKTTTYSITVNYAAVTSVTLSENTAEIGLEEVFDYNLVTVTVSPSNANQDYTWSVLSNTVNDDYVFDASGLLSGDTEGTVTLKCASDADASKYATLVVTITGNPTAAFVKESTSGYAGKSEEIAFTYGNIDDESKIIVASSNSSIVSVANDLAADEGEGLVTINFVAAGSANVTISYDGGETLDTLPVTVSADSVVSVSWNASNFDVFSGTTLTSDIDNTWLASYEMASGDEDLITYGDYTLKLGGTAITLPHTWVAADNGKTLCIEYGGVSSSTVSVTVTQTINSVFAPVPGETTTSTLTFTEQYSTGGATSDGGEEWTVESDGTESSFDATKGIHYGTGSAAVQYITLTTSDFASGTITSVVVNASTASGVSATASVTVGGNAFGGAAQSLSSSAADYTFTGETDAGEIVVTITKPSSATKAIYCKSIVVTYSTESGETVDIANNPSHKAAQRVAVAFAQAFNAAMDDTENCTTGLDAAWTTCSNAYNTFKAQAAALGSTEEAWAKNLVKYATVQWSDDSGEACIERMMKTYEVCVQKHGKTAFMSDLVTLGRANNTNPITIIGAKSDVNVIAIVVITSVVSLTAIGGYFFLRKRKENI